MESIFKSFNSLNTPSFSMPEITTWGIVCIAWMYLIGMIAAEVGAAAVIAPLVSNILLIAVPTALLVRWALEGRRF